MIFYRTAWAEHVRYQKGKKTHLSQQCPAFKVLGGLGMKPAAVVLTTWDRRSFQNGLLTKTGQGGLLQHQKKT